MKKEEQTQWRTYEYQRQISRFNTSNASIPVAIYSFLLTEYSTKLIKDEKESLRDTNYLTMYLLKLKILMKFHLLTYFGREYRVMQPNRALHRQLPNLSPRYTYDLETREVVGVTMRLEVYGICEGYTVPLQLVLYGNE